MHLHPLHLFALHLAQSLAYVPVGSVSRGLGAARLNWGCTELFFGGRAQYRGYKETKSPLLGRRNHDLSLVTDMKADALEKSKEERGGRFTSDEASSLSDRRSFFKALAGMSANEGSIPATFKEIRENGKKTLETCRMPHFKWEPYKYSKLQPLFKQTYVPPLGADTGRLRSILASHLFTEARGQQIVFVDGRFSPELSDLSALPDDKVRVGSALLPIEEERGSDDSSQWDVAIKAMQWLPEVDAVDENTCHGCLPFGALNAACLEDAAIVAVDEGTVLEKPIQVAFLTSGVLGDGALNSSVATHTRLVVSLGAGANTTIVQSYVGEGSYWCNGLSRFLLADGSNLKHIYAQEQSEMAQHLDSVQINVKNKASYTGVYFGLGANDGRVNILLGLDEEESYGSLQGICVTKGKQTLDTHTLIEHTAPCSTSRQQQRNIVTDSSQAIFKGLIRVHNEAQKTDSDQLCKSLMLSDKARINALPTLEINANDVTCTHGATVADLDEEEVFYLTSRGIGSIVAKGIAMRRFANEILEHAVEFEELIERSMSKLESIAPETKRAVETIYSNM